MIYKKTNSKFWYTKFQLSFGGKKKRVNCSTKEVLKSKAEVFEQRLRERLLADLTRKNADVGTWDEALAIYLDSRQGNRTIVSKIRKLTWWSQYFRQLPFHEISAKLILTTITSKSDIKLATKNRYLSEIKSFLNFVYKELEWIERIPHIKTFKEQEKAFYKLSESDVERLMNSSPPFLRPIILFALWTGFRVSNITGLKWSNVDLHNRTLKIEAEHHKSGSSALQPMNDNVNALLRSMDVEKSSVFVFLNVDGQPIKELHRRIWYRATKAAGLEGLRFHDLRHNWASRHAESGTDLLAIKELGGWKTLDMVQRYTHPSLNYLAKQTNNIVDPLAKLNRQKPSCDKKSSHFVPIGGWMLEKDEAQKWKNLLTFNKLRGSNNGAQTRNRTTDTRIFNPLLYQLSYLGKSGNVAGLCLLRCGCVLNGFSAFKSTTLCDLFSLY